MQASWLFYGYGFLSLLGAVVLTIRGKSRRKVLGTILVFWILGGSVIHQEIFNMPLTQLGGNLQIQQLMVLVLFLYLIISVVVELPPVKGTAIRKFEKYYVLFAICFLIVLSYHLATGMLTIREFRGFMEGTLFALLVYLLLRRYADNELIKTLAGAIILLGMITSLVSIIQFSYSPDFLRVGIGYGAFGETYRSKGIYTTEYLNSFVILVAASTALFWVSRKKIKIILLLLFGIAVLVTFHRMSWLASVVIFSFYGIVTKKVRFPVVLTIGGLGLLLSALSIAGVGPFTSENIQGSTFYKSRFTADTMTDRLKLYSMVIDNFDKIAIAGAGSTRSSLYYHGMLGTGFVDERWALGQRGSIHNGYLELLFMYGLPLLIVYLLVLWKALWEFLKAGLRQKSTYFLPVMVLLLFACMNLTNSLPWYSAYGAICAMIIGISTRPVPPARERQPGQAAARIGEEG